MNSSFKPTNMKKINLSIPEPCHENWDQMAPIERGKFCSSCQKSVVDFTGMSDRQLAEFFKKTTGSVCGRFHQDQLRRDIAIPKKRIPWIKYFFQFTWPAFVLFLKSCGQKDKVQGDIMVKTQSMKVKDKVPNTGMVGMTLSQITYVDTFKKKAITTVSCSNDLIVGDVEMKTSQVDTEQIVDKSVDTSIVEGKNLLDTVVVTAYDNIVTGRFSSGMVIMTSKVSGQTDSLKQMPINKNIEKEYKLFPNPVRPGSLLTIAHSQNAEVPEIAQICNSSGQVIASIKQNITEYSSVFDITIPSNLTAGIYFVQLIGKGKLLKTEKVVVSY
jgi:hypothetical protein